MNNEFVQNIINIYGENGKYWLEYLPNIVSDISIQWNLSDLVLINDLSFNYVLFGKQNKEEIVLKISFDSKLIHNERTALLALARYGAVEVLNYKDKILLLKKISPGISLKSYLPKKKNEALEIACKVVQKLQQAVLPVNIKLPSIEDRFSALDYDWPLEQNILLKARIIRDEIFQKYSSRKVLHGDLHYENILQDKDEWKIIDPHGVVGFPINEIWHLIDDIDNDVSFISNYFGFSREDIIKCYFIHSVLSAVWSVEDNLDPTKFLKMASKVYGSVFDK